MANITEATTWQPNINQVQTTDPLLGGDDTTVMNLAAKQLADRTQWLKTAMRGFNAFTFLSESKTLTPADVLQALVVINGNGTSQTYLLPVTGIVPGTVISIVAQNVTKQVTISSQGLPITYTATSRTKLYLGDGEGVQLVYTGDGFILWNNNTQLLEVGDHLFSYSLKTNTVIASGQLLNRLDYPRLWEYAQTLGGSLVSDTTWASAGNHGFFSTGNNLTTFRVPDLRAMFIRGLDLAAGIDLGRLSENPGGYEADEFKQHTHSINIPSRDLVNVGDFGPDLTADPAIEGESRSFTTQNAGGLETRPKNIGLLPLIKI
jgi:hypothetical protein